MTQNTTPNEKPSVLKIIATFVFIGVLMFVAWLSIQLVHLFPSAVNSLASLAEGVNQYPETVIYSIDTPATLQVSSNTSLLTAGSKTDISWDSVQSEGDYLFSYECADGLSVSLIIDQHSRTIDCEENFNIGKTESIELLVESEKNRYVDLRYVITFVSSEGKSPLALGNSALTVVNTEIKNGPLAENENTTTEVNIPVTSSNDFGFVPDTTPTNTLSTIPAVTPFTDLATEFIGVGEIVNGVFVAGAVQKNKAGAVQFAIKNIGNSASGNWNYNVVLPNNTHLSPMQTSLLPNERSVITIGFPAADVTRHTFVVSTVADQDNNAKNNLFAQEINFVQ